MLRKSVVIAISVLIFTMCNNNIPVKVNNTTLNETYLQGKWLLTNSYVLKDYGYYAQYDTLNFKGNFYERKNYCYLFPCVGLQKGTFTVKSDSIVFLGLNFTTDSLYNKLDSVNGDHNWKCTVQDDSSLIILGSTNVTIRKVKEFF